MLRFLLRLFTFVLLAVVIASRFGFPELLASEISGTYLAELANQDRQKKGLKALKYNKKLERAAMLKAENMFKLQYWSHYGPNKESPWQFIIQSGYSYAYAGENLAKGFSDSKSVHDAWMASPTHRANILDAQFQEVGIAVLKGKLLGSDVFLVVQMFGSPVYQPTSNAGQTPQTPEKNPVLRLTNPRDGDILEDGITDIRGEVTDMGNPLVTLYINQTLLGTAQTKNSTFSLSVPITAAEGEQTISARAATNDDIYITDSVAITVLNKDGESLGIAETCISSRRTSMSLEVRYTCERELQLFSATVGSTRYMHGKNVREVNIPLASLPKENAPVTLSLVFQDKKATTIVSNLEKLGREQSSGLGAGLTNGFTLGISSLRDAVFLLFALTFIILLVYTAQLAYKRQLSRHRYEIISFTLFIGILLIAFNFGFVRV